MHNTQLSTVLETMSLAIFILQPRPPKVSKLHYWNHLGYIDSVPPHYITLKMEFRVLSQNVDSSTNNCGPSQSTTVLSYAVSGWDLKKIFFFTTIIQLKKTVVQLHFYTDIYTDQFFLSALIDLNRICCAGHIKYSKRKWHIYNFDSPCCMWHVCT